MKPFRLLPVLLLAAALMAPPLFPRVTIAEEGHDREKSVGSFDGLRDAVENAPTDGTQTRIQLENGFTLGGELTIDGGRNIVLTGTGALRAANGRRHFTVEGGGTLTLDGVVLTGGQATDGNGGSVYVGRGGAFRMDGGAIEDNEASDGGGVYVYAQGVFSMGGGEISGNRADRGGGVFVYANIRLSTDHGGNAFVMENGRISGNSATYGGGVYTEAHTVPAGSAIFTARNGEISGNTAAMDGGGIFCGHYSFLTVDGAVRFSGNQSLSGDFDFGEENRGVSYNITEGGTGNPGKIDWKTVSRANTHLLNNSDVNYTGEPLRHTHTGPMPAPDNGSETAAPKPPPSASNPTAPARSPGPVPVSPTPATPAPAQSEAPMHSPAPAQRTGPTPPVPTGRHIPADPSSPPPAVPGSVGYFLRDEAAAAQTPPDGPVIRLGGVRIPLYGSSVHGGAWALFNMLICLAGALSALYTLLRLHGTKGQKETVSLIAWRAMGMMMGVFGLILFLRTQDVSRPMVLVDDRAAAQACVYLLQAVSTSVTRRLEKRQSSFTASSMENS